MAWRGTIQIAIIFQDYDKDLIAPLDTFVAQLNGYIADAPEGTNPRIWFDFDHDYFDSGDTCEVKIIRDETEQEAELREAEESGANQEYEAAQQRDRQKRELAQLAALKAKYEGKE